MLEYCFMELTNQIIFVTLGVRNPGVQSDGVCLQLCGEIQETKDLLQPKQSF